MNVIETAVLEPQSLPPKAREMAAVPEPQSPPPKARDDVFKTQEISPCGELFTAQPLKPASRRKSLPADAWLAPKPPPERELKKVESVPKKGAFRDMREF